MNPDRDEMHAHAGSGLPDGTFDPSSGTDPEEASEPVMFRFGLPRRDFVQVLGAGLLVTLTVPSASGQNRGNAGERGARRGPSVAARVHVGEDGQVTVFTGKIEMGQGARAQITQAAAEELHVVPGSIRVVMGDTDRVPDDGLSAGSRTTPSTVPAVRSGVAAARRLLLRRAAARWSVPIESLSMSEGRIRHAETGRTIGMGELAGEPETREIFRDAVVEEGVEVTSVREWRVLGRSLAHPNLEAVVTGSHRFPSDESRPGMLHGRVLRPSAFGAKLRTLDTTLAESLPGIRVVRDGEFVGVTGPTTHAVGKAIAMLEEGATWDLVAQPSSRELFEHLRATARGGIPANPFGAERAAAKRTLEATYQVAYVQHVPMETRVALAEWQDDRLTVWTGTQNPFGYRRELARALRIGEDRVRVVVPDFGGGFGGKHTAEAAIEAARLARAVGRPVRVRWTRGEEFTWAYFRPAALIEVAASLDEAHRLTSWHFVNVNSGNSAVETPYRAGRSRCVHVAADAPLRQGSYRALAATANTFARESFMDELAVAVGADPLAFRLAHLDHPRLRPVLESLAVRVGWARRRDRREPGIGLGLACGTEKGSFTAACAEVVVPPGSREYTVRRLTIAFECGAVMNPGNLRAQIHSCVLQGLGPALREEMQFSEGRIRNASFGRYAVPRFRDVPELDILVLDRPDLPSVGAGETPLIGVAPAIANALFDATGRRVRRMPIRLGDGGAA